MPLTRTGEPVPAANRPQVTATQPRDPARYQVIGEHGRGGLGRVSRAHDRDLGRDIAIKELISRGNLSEVRFLREALITARLEHPGIVPVYEAGRWPDGTPFYAMKLVAGRPLRDLIAERTTVDERIGLLHHVIAVADAIAYAHGRDIIHRDLKPSNVIIGDFGETVVIDWGLAKDLSTTEETGLGGGLFRANHDTDLTATGSVLGTPAYMAPEQERGEHVDQRADVFAIGAMLWELCALQKVPPTEAHLRHRILRRSGIDRDLITILDKALDPDPTRRYPDAGALAADLKAFKAGARIAARSYSLFGMLAHWIRRHRALALSMATVTAIVLVGSVLYVRNIVVERDRADAALTTAEENARSATIANATSLLERDPTRAWQVLSSLRGSTPEVTVLRARVRAAGVADATLTVPFGIGDVRTSLSGTRFVVSTVDRALAIIDPHTMTSRQLADGMTLPAVFTVTEQHVYAVRRAGTLVLSKISFASGVMENLIELERLPEDLMVSEAGVFWQYSDGTVYTLAPGRSASLVASNVYQFSVVGSELATCDRNGSLRIGAPGGSRRSRASLGRCMDTWAWAYAPGGFVVPVDSDHIALYSRGRLQHLLLDRDRRVSVPSVSRLALSNSGVLGVVDHAGDGAFLRAGAAELTRVRFGQKAIIVRAYDGMVAWGFADGMVTVVDTKTDREWAIKAHPQIALCLHLLPPGDRLLTCDANELRLWVLSRDAPKFIARIPSSPYRVVLNDQGAALFDGRTGAVHLMSPGTAEVNLLHRHNLPAFGVAWCDSAACSAGWDGKLLCTSPDTKVRGWIFLTWSLEPRIQA